jgi:acyl-CoA synthetase (AMP-forming)/AMP-acid ligase II
MAVLPFFYSYGNSIMLTHIAAGGTLVVNQSFMYPNVILQQMVDHRVTGFSGVPSTYAILLNRSAIGKFRFPDLRYLTQAGAAMSPALAKKLQAVFPGTEIYIMYGQTEASARLAYLEPDELVRREGSIGKAIPGVTLILRDKEGKEVRTGRTGEIVARGENIMAGYWQHPGQTGEVLRREGLWTGDLARQDTDGFFYIVSRKSDIIKSGSHRIGPREIEDTLAEHPAVHEAAVVGIADEILDERILACIVLKDGVECGEKELIKYCRKELPAYKVPQEVHFLKELPKTATGKIRKVDLLS